MSSKLGEAIAIIILTLMAAIVVGGLLRILLTVLDYHR